MGNRKFVVIILIGIILIRGILKPYWLSIPRIGSLADWKVLYYIASLYPVIFAGILGIILIRKPSVKFILQTTGIICFSYLFSIVYFSLRLYFIWRGSEVGKYLLWPYSNYYFEIVYRYSFPYLICVISGLVSLAIFWLIYRLTNKRTLEKSELFISLLLGLIFGVNNLYIILGAFISGALWYLVNRQRVERIRLFTILILCGFLGLLIF